MAGESPKTNQIAATSISCLLSAMRATLRVQAVIGNPQPLHRPPAHQVLLHNLRSILRLHTAVPHRLRIDHHRGPVLALVQAAGLVDAHLPAQPSGFAQRLQLREQFAGAIRCARRPRSTRRPRIKADKNMMFKCRQAVPSKNRDPFQTNAPSPWSLSPCSLFPVP